MNWTTYLLECVDGSWYCGVTNRLEKRVATHNLGKGAKYTRSRLPVKFLAGRYGLSKSQALRLEYKVKKTKRSEKMGVLKNTPVSP